MPSAICTLFEGHYHYGVAVLINSLYKHGFRGNVYVGYRGEKPFWAKEIKNSTLNWPGAQLYQPVTDITLHFLPVTTTNHFTNHKPDFIVQVWEKCVNKSNTGGIFYFDPDIVNKCSWEFYDQWITFGVALVHEIVWNDMPASHPKRLQWATVSTSLGYTVKNNLSSYLNAGFIGVNKDQIGFIKMWSSLIEHAEKHFNFNKMKFSQSSNDNNLFSVGDQDLLNLTAMCTDEKMSEFGPEGMDFIGGGWLMSHATGSPKPWQWKPFTQALSGRPPRRVDRTYWDYINFPIITHSRGAVAKKKLAMALGSFIGRFYHRGNN